MSQNPWLLRNTKMTVKSAAIYTESDEVLMTRYAGGDSNAFEELFKRYEAKIYGFLKLKIKDPYLQKDVFQDTFLRLHKYRNRYLPTLHFRPWLFTLCYSAIIDAARKDKYRLETLSEEQISNYSTLETDNMEELKEILKRLPGREQKAISLRFFQGYSFEEIAAELNTSPVNVRKITSRAILQIKSLWRKET